MDHLTCKLNPSLSCQECVSNNLLNRKPMDNRYSYDNPPKVGTIILTPSGREAKVTSIGKHRSVNVKLLSCSLTLNLDANQCRKTPDTMVKEMGQNKALMEDFDARR